VTEDEVNSRIAFMAWQQNRRPEKLRQEYIRSGEIENLYLQLREQKTLDKILEKAKVTEGEYPAK
jgi:FKBP-type peptidyl-prolyl cis-trans isomerase (trigger factor)